MHRGRRTPRRTARRREQHRLDRVGLDRVVHRFPAVGDGHLVVSDRLEGRLEPPAGVVAVALVDGVPPWGVPVAMAGSKVNVLSACSAVAVHRSRSSWSPPNSSSL
ncbi:hypothetical protein [Natrinema hispanicum]|uniref:hypothetical protein n=1 Tax=Natrinema hispanicum TaxID=392421 RepID=UPI00102B9F94|nr:hypothetical protein [Natrinema hispanicum]